VPLLARAGRGRRDDHGVQQIIQLLHVVAVGLAEHDGEGDAGALGQQVALGAAFPAIGGVGPGRLRLPGPPCILERRSLTAEMR